MKLGFVPGLLNRLSESNVESITEEIAAIFRVLYLYLQLCSLFITVEATDSSTCYCLVLDLIV